ncbi:membrane protein insertase YidC [Undibacterium sp. TJN19]|uniref:membrane protein insertase YidC n=1 Tax=Undibacterium sp. TJN19 TaxID=3413055 RepID=UPI003BF39247
MDIKRTVLWVIFSMSLLMLWDGWARHNGKPSIFSPQVAQTKNASTPASASASGAASTTSAGNAATPGATAAAAGDTAAPVIKSERITITTDVVKADIDTIGGELKRLELLKHKDGTDHTHNVVLFDESAKRTYLAQTGLLGGPFPNHKTGFVAKPGVRTLGDGNQVQLVLEAEQNGVKLTKTYTFKKGDYIIDVRHDVTNNSTAAISPSLYLQLLHDGTKPESGGMFSGSGEFYAPAVYTESDKFQKLDFEKISKGTDSHAKESDNGWVAMLQHFFVSAFIPQDKTKREIFTKKVDANLYAVGNVLPMGTVAPGATVSMNARLYSGPQESAKLEAIAPGFELVKDYGVLTIIAKPLFWVMEQIHKMLGNWGWTIVVFTIAIKLALFPLSAAGYRSMAKMKVVTPKMQAVRERFKNDPQKMNQAMMELYKTEKINPLGGCFPILIQMPVFLSLYWVLQASVEMRGAPWVGWITDLTSPDPWYILPAVYAVSMYITTKLNPAPADPMQAKMMMFMPLIFSVMFFFFPSGLVLYWVVNNILSIAQQWVINNKLIPPEHKAQA